MSNNLKLLSGLHIYVGIKNLDALVIKEENKDNLRRIIHMIHNYFKSLTNLVNNYENAYIEKLTGGRLHVVFSGEPDDTSLTFMLKCLTLTENFNHLSKNSNYKNFIVSIGCDYGVFYNYIHKSDNELTSIGYCANRAAKLQELAEANQIVIPTKIINDINANMRNSRINSKYFNILEMRNFNNKYKTSENQYSTINLYDIPLNQRSISNSTLEYMKENHYAVNFKDIKFQDVKVKLNFNNLSRSLNKEFECIVFYADIRGFTKMFNEDGSNLNIMSELTIQVLELMQKIVEDHNGIKVQFQGDRISAIFHNYSENQSHNGYINDVVTAGVILVDEINKINSNIKNITQIEDNIAVGIGYSFGDIVATQITLNYVPHNIIIGKTVNYASKAEDEFAGKNQNVSHISHYRMLDSIFSDLFKDTNNKNYKITNCSRTQLKTIIATNNDKKNYNKQNNNGNGMRQYSEYISK